jgi:TolB protein
MKSTTFTKSFFFLALIFISGTSFAQPRELPSVGLGDGIRLYNGAPLSGRLLFVSINGTQNTLYSVTLSKQQLSPLITQNGAITSPSWSPDGSKVVFSLNQSGLSKLYLMKSDGTNVEELPSRSSNDTQPAWSPDGSAIIFASDGTDSTTNIFSIKLGDRSITQITRFKGKNSSPSWAPLTNQIAYTTNRFWPGQDICSIALKTNIERCIFSGRTSYLQPEYSHTGKLIACSNQDNDTSAINIYSFEKETEIHPQVTAAKSVDPTWSPDDKYLVFAASADDTRYDLYLYNVEQQVATLFLTSKSSLRYPSWAAETP